MKAAATAISNVIELVTTINEDQLVAVVSSLLNKVGSQWPSQRINMHLVSATFGGSLQIQLKLV